MGGCKCSYRSCNRNSDRKTHFFHYPVRQPPRCLQWMIHSNRLDYQQLQLSQLKNKVVCQYHFEDHMFINYKHDRLVHNAVPKPEDSRVKNEYCPPKVDQGEAEKLDLPSDSAIEQTNREESTMSVIVSPITGLSFISPVERKKKCSATYTEFLTRKTAGAGAPAGGAIGVPTPMRNVPVVAEADSPANRPIEPTPERRPKSERARRSAVVERKPAAIEPTEANDGIPKAEDGETKVGILEAHIEDAKEDRKRFEAPAPVARSRSSFPIAPLPPPKESADGPVAVDSPSDDRSIRLAKRTTIVSIPGTVCRFNPLSSTAKAVVTVERADGDAPRSSASGEGPSRVSILDDVRLKPPMSNRASQSVKVQTLESDSRRQADCMRLIRENAKEISELKRKLSERRPSGALEASERNLAADDDDDEDDGLARAVLYARIVPYLTPKLAKKVHAEMFPRMAKRKKF